MKRIACCLSLLVFLTGCVTQEACRSHTEEALIQLHKDGIITTIQLSYAIHGKPESNKALQPTAQPNADEEKKIILMLPRVDK